MISYDEFNGLDDMNDDDDQGARTVLSFFLSFYPSSRGIRCARCSNARSWGFVLVLYGGNNCACLVSLAPTQNVQVKLLSLNVFE